jgi:RNA polymerase sigma factor (sigma-70 family)
MAEDARNTEPSLRDSALQYLDGLYAYAMTLARNQAEAEDLVQETYVRAMRAFERLRPGSNLKSWFERESMLVRRLRPPSIAVLTDLTVSACNARKKSLQSV